MTGTPCNPGFAGFRLTSAAILALLLLLPSGVHGDVLKVEFPEAVSRAMKNNPFLSAAGEEWMAAKEDAVAARGYYLPSVALESRFVRTSIPSEAFAFRINQERMLPSDFASVDNFNKPSPIDEYMTSLTVEQALFAPKAWLGRRMAVREAGALRGFEGEADGRSPAAPSARGEQEARHEQDQASARVHVVFSVSWWKEGASGDEVRGAAAGVSNGGGPSSPLRPLPSLWPALQSAPHAS